LKAPWLSHAHPFAVHLSGVGGQNLEYLHRGEEAAEVYAEAGGLWVSWRKSSCFKLCFPWENLIKSDQISYNILLVGGLEHFLFSIIYGIILPIDEYVSRWLKPPTRL
jgi:hypothetical protein